MASFSAQQVRPLCSLQRVVNHKNSIFKVRLNHSNVEISSTMNLNLKATYQPRRASTSAKAAQDERASFLTTPHPEEGLKMEEVSWVDLYLPEEVRPYARLARLHRPIVTWLYVWPAFWAISLATSPGQLPNLGLLALFGLASLPIRGYACTINDFFDRDMDQKVTRSKKRPIANGDVTPLQALCFLALQFCVCAALALPLNNCSKLVAVPFLPVFSLYPLMKRLTYWPQAYLGFSFSWLAIVAWSAVKGSLDPAVLIPLYISLALWTLVYDTIYAHQDREDDVKAGVKSTAVLFGDSTKIWITGFAIICIGCLALCGFYSNIGWPFYASLVAASGHLTWQITTVDLSNSTECRNMFISNAWFGAIVFFGICLGRLLH